MEEAWSIAIAAVSVLVTIGVFWIKQHLDGERSRREARRVLVGQVLDRVDRVARAAPLMPISSIWMNPVIELIQVLPRLVLELDRRDRVVAIWFYGQVQRLVAASSNRDVIRISLEIGYAMSSWHSGEKPRSWFQGELEARPVDEAFTVPRSFRTRSALPAVASMLAVPFVWGWLTGLGRALVPTVWR